MDVAIGSGLFLVRDHYMAKTEKLKKAKEIIKSQKTARTEQLEAWKKAKDTKGLQPPEAGRGLP